jgi:outer membrane protein assembly factor BamD (BamD/ComL family)
VSPVVNSFSTAPECSNNLDFNEPNAHPDTANRKSMPKAISASLNFFVPNILPANACGSKIFPRFSPYSMIPQDRGGGGVPHQTSTFPFQEFAIFSLILFVSLITTPRASAQALRGTLIHEETIRVSPGVDNAKLGEAQRGHELIIIDSSREWTHVEAILREAAKDADEDDEAAQGKTITGWVLSKALVSINTPNGDKIIFGEAVNSEDEASRRRGRRDAAQDAMRLYYRVYDLFPNSPLAAEGLYRAADIRWQMERSDIMTRPSAREREAFMRGQMDEEWMKQVMKKYPGTKWADLAAFRLIENKLCGDWQSASKCPEKEAETYEKYAKDHDQSPAAPEALYQAAWRQSALIEIYKTEANQKKSEAAKARALDLAQRIVSQYGQSPWALRATTLIDYIQQGIVTYGNSTD